MVEKIFFASGNIVFGVDCGFFGLFIVVLEVVFDSRNGTD